MAKAVDEGLLPYKDFFYAHPPLQLFLFQPILFIFGANFIAIKIFILILSISSVVLTYLIAREIFGKSSAFLSAAFFLVFPGFLIFSNQSMGMFEALPFFLSGFYFLIKRRLLLSIAFLIIAIFTRYMVVLLLPFLFYYLLQFDKKSLTKFIKFLFSSVSLTAVVFTVFFGKNFFIDTLIYHTQANLNIGLAQWVDQYLTLGFFTIFLSLTALLFAIVRKNNKILIFAAYPLLYDILVLFSLKAVIYHYFILSLPLLFIAIGAVFAKSKYFIVRAAIITILIFSIMTNLSSIGLYFDRSVNEVFPILVDYSVKNLGKDDLIFGEPRTTNYMSFVTGAKIVNNYFDSDLKFINFAGKEEVFNNVKKAKPKIIIIDNRFNYISNFEGYSYVNKWEVPNYYSVSLYRLMP